MPRATETSNGDIDELDRCASVGRGGGREALQLRHALASAMAANKEPASIIAAQLRHADGGGLAQRVYIHQLPQTAPRVAGLIEGVFGPAARGAQVMPTVSAGRRVEGNRRETGASNPA